MHDMLIRGALVVGAGIDNGPSVEIDVALEGATIAAVGKGLGPAKQTIDGRGKLLVPGFIDIHTHSDFTLPVRPAGTAKLLQGITTDVTGNCGFSPFPLDGSTVSVRHGSFVEAELAERWPSFDAFAEDVESRELGINVAPLVGLGAVRLAVLGEDDVSATQVELARMGELVRAALRQGAFGASSGLVYAPSSYADSTELRTLATVVAEEGGIYATHMRDEGDGLLTAIEEALTVARESGCPLQISHLKALGRANWGLVGRALELLDAAMRDGHDVWIDAYPYTAGSSTIASLLPAAELAGGEDGLHARLRDRRHRERLMALLESNTNLDLEDVVLATVPSRPQLEGLRLGEAARDEEVGLPELILRLLEQDGSRVSMVVFGIAEDDLREVLRHPRTLVGSDGWTMSTDAATYAHPRSFASAVRILSRYTRDEHVLDLPTAVAKMTTLPARRMGLLDRGVIEPGAVADLVVLDLDRLAEISTFEHPCAYPDGIEHVFVHGEHAVEDGALTGVRAGRVLRRSRNGTPQ